MGTEFSSASVSYPVCSTSKLGKGSRLKLASVMLPLKLKSTRLKIKDLLLFNPCHHVAAQVFEQALGMEHPRLTRWRS